MNPCPESRGSTYHCPMGCHSGFAEIINIQIEIKWKIWSSIVERDHKIAAEQRSGLKVPNGDNNLSKESE